MNCPEFETLMRYLDGELGESEAEAVREHLGECGKCRILLESQRSMESSWRSAFTLPDESEFRLMEERIFRSANRRKRWTAALPIAAGLVAVILGLKLIMARGPMVMDSRETIPGRSPAVEAQQLRDDEAVPEEQDAVEEMILDDTVTETRLSTSAADADDGTVQFSSDASESSGGLDQVSPEGVTGVMQESFEEVPHDVFDSSSSPAESRGLLGAAESSTEMTGGGGGYGGIAAGTGSAGEPETGSTSSPETEADIVLSCTEETGEELEEEETAASLTGAESGDFQQVEEAGSILGPSPVQETQQSEIACDAAPEDANRYFSLNAETASEMSVTLVIDEAGMPDSLSAALLDSLMPLWRDYIPFVFTDTVMTVSPAELCQLLEEGEATAAETQN